MFIFGKVIDILIEKSKNMKLFPYKLFLKIKPSDLVFLVFKTCFLL